MKESPLNLYRKIGKWFIIGILLFINYGLVVPRLVSCRSDLGVVAGFGLSLLPLFYFFVWYYRKICFEQKDLKRHL